MRVIELLHGVCWEELACKLEALYHWLYLFNYIDDCLMVFEGVLDVDAEELCLCILFKGGFVDFEF